MAAKAATLTADQQHRAAMAVEQEGVEEDMEHLHSAAMLVQLHGMTVGPTTRPSLS